ncbi:MAG: MarR family winged helix-turn-helix transcriptional regulator [Caulobacteraceae bacterium]
MEQVLFHRLLGIFEFKKDYQLKSSGLNYVQLHTLEGICKEGELKTLDISRLLGISPSTLIGILDELEKKKLIKRERQKDDKRVVLVKASEEGRKKVQQHIEEDKAFLRNLTAALDEREEKLLSELLEKITGSIGRLEELFRNN